MATSKHRAIRVAVAALLTAVPALAGGRVVENRDFTLPTDIASQVHVNYRGTNPERAGMAQAPYDWTTEIEVVIRARRTAGSVTSAEDVADEIWTETFARVMADQSLGGLVEYLDPGPANVEDDQADTDVCRLTWTFTVTHRTNNGSIAA